MEYKEYVNHQEFFQRLHTAYSYLGDALSKKIFDARLRLYMQGGVDTLCECTTKEVQDRFSRYMSYHKESLSVYDMQLEENETVIIYGAGFIGEIYFNYLSINFACKILFCDKNHETKQMHCGVCVISPNELIEKYKDAKVVIAAAGAFDEIYQFLHKNGVKEISINPIFADGKKQYFDEVLQLTENEVFMDIGAFDGMTSRRFAKHCNQKYRKIYLFEPDISKEEQIKNTIEDLHDAEFYGSGVGIWHEEGILKFQTTATGSSISEDGDIEIKTDTIDHILKVNKETFLPPTFIKMDIEGAELSALKGGAETIKKYKPKLAICVYHKAEDIIELPMYIKSLVPEYKLYMRQYTNGLLETVLYAVL